jgi:hypothetical protein
MATAADLVALSEWCACVLRHRASAGAPDGASLLEALVVPCAISYDVLALVIRALYEGSIELGPDNLEHVLRLADAMQIPQLQAACEAYAADSIASGDAAWAVGVHNLAAALSMTGLAGKALQALVVKAASDASCLPALATALEALGGPAAQLAALRSGISSRCGESWPQSFLVVLLLRLDQLACPQPPPEAAAAFGRGGASSTSSSASLAGDSARASLEGRAAPDPAPAGGIDVSALLDEVDLGALEPEEWRTLTQQVLGCSRDTPALRALMRQLLQRAADQLYNPSSPGLPSVSLPPSPSASLAGGATCSLDLELKSADELAAAAGEDGR